MKKIDIHGGIGILGTAISAGIDTWSHIMAGCAATATAAYMIIRACREYRKYRRDTITIKVQQQPEEKK